MTFRVITSLGNIWTDWLTVIGTVGAVAAALFLQLTVPHWRRPKLEIPDWACPERVTDLDKDGEPGEWWDIPIVNSGRGTTARAAQVMLTSVVPLDTAATSETRVPLRSLKWTHLEDALAEIPAGVTRSVELGKIKPKGVGPLRLGIFPEVANSQRNELTTGHYRLEFALVARNVRARYYRLDVVLHDGTPSFPTGIVPVREPQSAPDRGFQRLLRAREEKKWDSFSWITARALISSLNHVINLSAPGLVGDLRTRWMERRSAESLVRWGNNLIVDRRSDTSFIVLGDPGEQDESQYVLVPALRAHTDVGFMVICSDVVYPSGDINDYVDALYVPYGELPMPIYALPGNHDWYDGLVGFMWHFCGARPLDATAYQGGKPYEWLSRLLWRRPSRPKRRLNLEKRRAERWPDGPLQPGPYYAIDTQHVRIVCIDTGIKGEIDACQRDWLVRVSRGDKPKVLLTGKPLIVDGRSHPCPVDEGSAGDESGFPTRSPALRAFATVENIVHHGPHRYVAVIGGDVHNFQHYEHWANGHCVHHVVAGGGGAYMSATHPVALEVGENPTEEDEVPPLHLYPSRERSLQHFARLLLPAVWRLMRGLLAILAGLGAAFAAVKLHVDAAALRIALQWAAVALAAGIIVRFFLPHRWVGTRRYRFCVVTLALLGGVVLGLTGWWLAPARFDEDLGGWAALVAGGSLVAILIRRTEWWRARDSAAGGRSRWGIPLVAKAWIALIILLSLAVIVMLIFDVDGVRVWLAVVMTALAVIAGWRARRWRSWSSWAPTIAYIVQLVDALVILEEWVVPAAARPALGGAVAGVVGLLILALPVAIALVLCILVSAAVVAWMRTESLRAAWSRVGAAGLPLVVLLIAAGVGAAGVGLSGSGVETDAWRAGITAALTLAIPIAAAFGVDWVRRRTGPRVYKFAIVGVIGIIAVVLWRLGVLDTWFPRAAVAGAAILAMAVIGILIVHLTFLRAHALLRDWETHVDQDQLSDAEAREVIEWRSGKNAPKDRRVRRRADIVFPGASRPHGPLQTKVAEIFDSDRPPFWKNFLVVDATETTLTITAHWVTGETATPEPHRIPIDLRPVS